MGNTHIDTVHLLTIVSSSDQLLVLAMSSQEVISSLRGKVLERPSRKISHGENQRPCDILHEDWTPYNSNLQMQGIKVVEINPVPAVKKGDAFEDTMMLIDMMKQQAEKE